MISSDQQSLKENTKHLPGYEALWFVIGGYQLAFGLFFGIFAFYKLQDREFYSQHQDLLSQHLGFANTLILLTSSWFAAAAIKSFRRNNLQLAQRYLYLAVMCGALFSVIKFIEYEKSISAGYTLLSNDFFTFYYLLTGLHLMHVWIGMGGLLIARALLKKNALSEDDTLMVESCAVFWHMVDYLWIMIFPLLYLMQ